MFGGLSINGYRKQENLFCLQKRKEKTSIKPIRVSINERKAKWPYMRVSQRRNTHKIGLGKIQSKISRNCVII